MMQSSAWQQQFLQFISNPFVILLIGFTAQWAGNKILDLFPNYIGYRIRYNIKSLWKWVINAPINIIYTLKTQELSLCPEDYSEALITITKDNGYEYLSEAGTAKTYSTNYGEISPDIEFSISYEDVDDAFEGEVNIDYVQVQCKLTTGFRSFRDDLYELEKFNQVLNKSFNDLFNELHNDSLTCLLGGMYKMTGILKEIELTSLFGKLGDVKVDLYDDQIILYGVILRNEINKLKKIITYYY